MQTLAGNINMQTLVGNAPAQGSYPVGNTPARSGFPKRSNPIREDFLPREKGKRARRAWFHDYCAPGMYMITVTCKRYEEYPFRILSSIPKESIESLKKGLIINPLLSSLGRKIEGELRNIPRFHPEIEVKQMVIMPDHIHFRIIVRKRLAKMLGQELAGFLGACSKHYSEEIGSSEVIPLFEPFHDTIIFDRLQLDRCISYIQDNPRKYAIKREYPDLYKSYLHLKIGDREYAAYGNIFLLKSIYLLPIRIHRRWSEKEFADYHRSAMIEMEKGATPISPFIHKAEKAIMYEAIKQGSSVIRLVDRGFTERYKPGGEEFELCSEGRLLLLAPWPENIGKKSTAGYNEFHSMNDMAKELAEMPTNVRMSIV